VVAGSPTTIRLATGILILPQRSPLILAKEVATLDVLSGGRVILGIGVGWLEEEYAALGLPFSRRGERAEEYVRALRRLWTEPAAVSFEGSFVSFAEVYSRPLPVQRPVPVVVGGHSPRAAHRAGRIGDGFFPASAARDRLPSLVETARRAAESAGRDPAALEITMGAPPVASEVEALSEVGVDRVVLPAYLGIEFLAEFAAEMGLGA
jgi:probable F420-dependent oxidoreductase